MQREKLQTDELPITVESNEEGQTTIEEGECGICGYDRVRVAYDTINDDHMERCMNCDALHYPGEGWERPQTDSDRLKDVRKSADGDGPYEKLGEIGGSRFSHGTEVFQDVHTNRIIYFTHSRDGTSVTYNSIRWDTFEGILGKLDAETIASMIEDNTLDGKQLNVILELLPHGMMLTSTEDDE